MKIQFQFLSIRFGFGFLKFSITLLPVSTTGPNLEIRCSRETTERNSREEWSFTIPKPWAWPHKMNFMRLLRFTKKFVKIILQFKSGFIKRRKNSITRSIPAMTSVTAITKFLTLMQIFIRQVLTTFVQRTKNQPLIYLKNIFTCTTAITSKKYYSWRKSTQTIHTI